ncbi:MAG: hypothetical protein OHK0032_01400 [Thermodesulfovibrionales bacterium]
MRYRVTGILLFFAGLMIVLTPRFILPVCEYQGHPRMACSYTGLSEMFIGAIIISASIGTFFSKTNESLRWLMLVAFIGGLSAILIPMVLGYCGSSRMPCNYGTIPALRLEGSIVLAVSTAGFVLSFIKRISRRG